MRAPIPPQRTLLAALCALSWAAVATAQDDSASGPSNDGAVPQPVAAPEAGKDFIDQDGDDSPGPVRHTFKSDSLLNGKVGLGAFAIGSEPTGVRSGYSTLFTEGDWLGAFGTGLGVHWDFDLRVGLGVFEQRNGNVFNGLEDTGVADYYQTPANFYDHAKTFATGRTTDYWRIDKLFLSYDLESVGFDLGRVRINEASSQIVDGVQVRVDVGGQRFGAFGGLRPNPWHQQVVGAASGGFVPLDYEFVPVLWGGTAANPDVGFNGETLGPYSNDIGPSLFGYGTPWVQLASYRFQSVGLWTALRLDPGFIDFALVGDFFFDPKKGIEPAAYDGASQANETETALVDGGSGFRVDRVWAYTSGGIRFLQNATLAWRGTLDIIGARALMPRDLFVDFTWRDIGPLSFSLSYFKINTYATAYAFARFFQPLEQPSSLPALDENGLAINRDFRDLINVNNTQLFVVDRDRVRARASLFISGALQAYLDTTAERRADFAYTPVELGESFSNFTAGLNSIGDAAPEWFSCGSPSEVDVGEDGRPIVPVGAPQGSNPTVPVWADRCKLGASVGLRDPFLAGLGAFDVRATQMFGYFTSSTRLSGQLGVSLADMVWLDLVGGIERNNYHRIFQPLAPGIQVGGYPAYGFLPASTNLADFSATVSWNVWKGFVVDGSYFAYAEQIPYQGDSGFLGGNQRIDPVQLTQMLFVRGMYRF